jgi:hypothetical protein
MGIVFVNYRVKDDPLGAASIHDMLARRFGADRVFRDKVSMKPGEHYPKSLRAALEEADVLVAVIGPRWNDLDDDGQLLIQRDRDWVRWEIARAIQRGIPIVPVLLRDTPENATPPDRAILPASISELANLQTLEVSQKRLGEDLDRLADRLVELVPSLAPGRRIRRVVLAAGGLLAAGGAVVGVLAAFNEPGPAAAGPGSTTPPAPSSTAPDSSSPASYGMTLQVTPDHGSTSATFTVKGQGCVPGKIVDIHFGNDVAGYKTLYLSPTCRTDHSYQISYDPDRNGALTSIDATGTTRADVPLSPGSTYTVQAQADGLISPSVTYRVG